MPVLNGNFYLDRVKVYLDGVLSDEEHIRSYSDCASDIYRVNSHKERIGVKDVESWLRGLPIGISYDYSKTIPLAHDFCKDISSLTRTTRSEDDCYWWALATCIWVYGGMKAENPQFRG